MSVQTTYTTSPAIALEGQRYPTQGEDIISMVNREASAEMDFGLAVVWEVPEGGTEDAGALAPDAIDEIVAGILVHSHAYAKPDQLGDDGVKPGEKLSVMRKGKIWVKPEDAVAPGDRLFIRAVVAGGEREGAVRMSADSTDCIDSTGQGVFLTSAGAGELALLEVDFTNLAA